MRIEKFVCDSCENEYEAEDMSHAGVLRLQIERRDLRDLPGYVKGTSHRVIDVCLNCSTNMNFDEVIHRVVRNWDEDIAAGVTSRRNGG